MNIRMSGNDISLNNFVKSNSSDDQETELLDILPDAKPSHEYVYEENQDYKKKKKLFSKALMRLNEREKDIIFERRLKDEPSTLDELSKKYAISCERVRQIETRAIEKLEGYVREEA